MAWFNRGFRAMRSSRPNLELLAGSLSLGSANQLRNVIEIPYLRVSIPVEQAPSVRAYSIGILKNIRIGGLDFSLGEKPPVSKYPEDAREKDLERIGMDMRRALSAHYRNSDKDSGPALPEQKAQPDTSAAIAEVSFDGPLPPPGMLGHYEEVCTGSAERILSMAEIEQGRRIEIESTALNTFRLTALIGQLITAPTVIGAAILALLGHKFLATALAVLVGVPSIVNVLRKE